MEREVRPITPRRRRVLTLLLVLAGCVHAPARGPAPRFMAIYRWRVREECAARFVAAWEAETARFHARWGSRGTRLYRADDETFVATALWPSEEAWSRAHAQPIDVPWAEAVNAACIERKEQELHLQLLEDLAEPP